MAGYSLVGSIVNYSKAGNLIAGYSITGYSVVGCSVVGYSLVCCSIVGYSLVGYSTVGYPIIHQRFPYRWSSYESVFYRRSYNGM